MLVENELNKIETFDLSYFIGKCHFEEDGTQNYLVFQQLNRYFKIAANTKYISSWQSKGLSEKTIKPPTTSDYKLNLQLNYFGIKTRLEFRGSCLKQDKNTFNHGRIVNICIVYELDKTYVKTHPTLLNCLFGAVSITKNADIDKNFGVDMSSSAHVDNKRKDILILGTGPTQGLGEHSLNAEKMYSINFTDYRKKCCLSLHYNSANSYLFVNGTEIIKFKAKDFNIIATPLCLGNISKDWSVDNMKDI